MKSQITNHKSQTNPKSQSQDSKRFWPLKFRSFKFVWNLVLGAWNLDQKGITLLLVVVILSALLSISIGIFNVVFGQIKISGEIADSFVAFYNADRAIEKFLYRDRVGGGLGDGYTEDTTADETTDWCYRTVINKTENLCGTGNIACIKSIGQYRCGPNPNRVVKRGFQVVY